MTSLFSFQFLNPAMSQDYVNKYAGSGVDIIKVLDPDKAPWLWPSNIKCVARFHFNNADEPLVWQGRAGARKWFSWVKPRILACPVGSILAVETPNEVNPSGPSDCPSWCDFMDEAAIWLHSIGIKIVVGNFGVTHPSWFGYGPFIARGLEKADYLGLHEYKMKDRLSISMATEALPTERWWVFRYMRLVKEIQGVGGRIPDILITEFGVDYAGDPNNDGWRATNLGAIGMFNLSLEYDKFCKQFGYVKKIFSFASNPYQGQWSSFNNDGELNDLLIAYIRKEAQMTVLNIDGRLMNAEQFEKHVQATDLSWADTIVIHHTFRPNKQQWADCGWECRKENMRLYYQDTLGWDSGPHLFVSDEGIGLFSPLSKPGTGVVGHNSHTIHVEIVGDYSIEFPVDETYTNTILACASLLRRMPASAKLTYHKALQPDTTCPGNGIIEDFHVLEIAVWEEANVVDLSQEAATATKIRWHVEEAYRELKAIGVKQWEKPMQRLYELIRLDGGLMYRWENANA